jgi:hypothetical protein
MAATGKKIILSPTVAHRMIRSPEIKNPFFAGFLFPGAAASGVTYRGNGKLAPFS